MKDSNVQSIIRCFLIDRIWSSCFLILFLITFSISCSTTTQSEEETPAYTQNPYYQRLKIDLNNYGDSKTFDRRNYEVLRIDINRELTSGLIDTSAANALFNLLDTYHAAFLRERITSFCQTTYLFSNEAMVPLQTELEALAHVDEVLKKQSRYMVEQYLKLSKYLREVPWISRNQEYRQYRHKQYNDFLNQVLIEEHFNSNDALSDKIYDVQDGMSKWSSSHDNIDSAVEDILCDCKSNWRNLVYFEFSAFYRKVCDFEKLRNNYNQYGNVSTDLTYYDDLLTSITPYGELFQKGVFNSRYISFKESLESRRAIVIEELRQEEEDF